MNARRALVAAVALFSLLLALAPAAPAQVAAASKPAVVRLGTNQWRLRATLTSGPATTTFGYGRAGDVPLMCDWDGNGSRTPGVVRPAADGRWQWLLKNSASSGAADRAFSYGRWDLQDEPICGSWNGARAQTIGVVRFPAQTGVLRWLLRTSNTAGAATIAFNYARMTDPDEFPFLVVGDWNGNNVDTPGVVWPRTRLLWQLRNANSGGAANVSLNYGIRDDFPLSGDWNGNGRDTMGVQRFEEDQDAVWLLRNTLTAGSANVQVRYGAFEDWPVVWR